MPDPTRPDLAKKEFVKKQARWWVVRKDGVREEVTDHVRIVEHEGGATIEFERGAVILREGDSLRYENTQTESDD